MIRIDFLTLIRYPLAIWVLLYHLIDPTYLIWPKLSSVDRAMIETGKLAPSIFFIISGFVITQSLVNKPGIRNFYYRRLAYVLPIFIFTATLMAYKFELDRDSYFLNIFAITPFFFSSEWFVLNGPAWSLIIEIWFYLLIPLYFTKLLKFSKPKIYIFLILSIQLLLPILLRMLLDEEIVYNFIYHNPVYHVLNFLLGIFLYSNFKQQNKLSSFKIVCLKIVSYGLFFTGIMLTYVISSEVYKYGSFVLPGAIALIYTYSAEQKFKVNSKVFRKISYVGESAFAIYITQWLWIGLVREKINGITNFPEFIFSLLIIIIFVTLIAQLFDKFVLRLILNFRFQNKKLRLLSLLLLVTSVFGLSFASTKSTPYLTPETIKSTDSLLLSDSKLLKQNDNSIIIQSKAENTSSQNIIINSCTFFANRISPQTEREKFIKFKLDINGEISAGKTSWLESRIDKQDKIYTDVFEIYESGSSNFKIACN